MFSLPVITRSKGGEMGLFGVGLSVVYILAGGKKLLDFRVGNEHTVIILQRCGFCDYLHGDYALCFDHIWSCSSVESVV